MAIGVGEIKIVLAPFGVVGSGRGLMAGFQRTLIKRIDITDVEMTRPHHDHCFSLPGAIKLR